MINRSSSVAHFLGAEAARGGPFALLGIEPDRSDHGSVIGALERRLAQVNGHPHSETPQADEVRLALHAAAAQLLDPVVRRHMLERWGQGGTSDASQVSPAISSESLALERDAILMLAMHGGWNRESLRRLAMLAHARGVPSHRVAQTIRAIAHQRRSQPPTRRRQQQAQPPAPPRARPLRALPVLEPLLDQDESRSSSPWLVPLLTVGTVLAALGAIALVSMLSSSTPSRAIPSPQTMGAREDAGVPAPETTAVATAQTDQRPPDAQSLPSVTDLLTRAREGLEIDPTRAERDLRAAIDAFERSWASMASDELVSAHADLVDLLYRISAVPSRGVAIASRIARASERPDPPSTGEDLLARVWSAGMLNRLSREANLPAQVARVIDDALVAQNPGMPSPQEATFNSGAQDALRTWTLQLAQAQQHSTDPEGLWQAWIDAALALTPDDPQTRTRLMLAAIDDLLRLGPEGSRSAWLHTTVRSLVEHVDWSKDSPARRWLLASFNAQGISSADLHLVTSALARLPAVEGVDPTMTLDAQASGRARQALRRQYAGAWGLIEQAEGDALEQEWRDRLARAQRTLSGALTPDEHLASAAEMALLHATADALWRGEFEHARTVLDSLDDVLRVAQQRRRGRTRSLSEHEGGDWAVRYIAVKRNLQARLELLDALQRSRGKRLTPMEAEVLVLEAVRGDRQTIRQRAREVVRQVLDQPTVVNALLEALPDTPETTRNLRLISDAASLGSLDAQDPNWRIKARRALVERLLELVAGQSDASVMDAMSEAIADAYAQMLAGPAGEIPTLTPLEAVSQVRRRWHQQASGLLGAPAISPDRIEQDRKARRASARGPVQAFDAEQRALCELMAYVLTAEQPELAHEIEDELARWRRSRQGARHIFEQIAANERTIATLWNFRLRD